MKTLYDLLGALPDDDADALRAAFRRAVKTHHPDRNPGDPAALLKFRKIVHANAILSDPQQRGSYDRLLQVALRQPAPRSKRDIFLQRMRRLASDVLAACLVSAISIAGYQIFQSRSGTSQLPPRAIELPQGAQAQPLALASKQTLDVTSQTAPAEQRDDVATVADPDPSITPAAAAEPEAIAPAAGVPAPEDASTTGSTATSPTVKDAGYYRERGIAAYRRGDLEVALVDFDLAISIDPDVVENYVDRSIVFYRLGDRKRAFADIAEAKSIEDARAGHGHGR
ncbi:MAG: DnaJ domain-containing protein [Bradyrhizobium sp.]|uniref:DnaJ domain-containing protein n=1 Tax=Bradyrhizobium sp. TaxID=376 RepID=UPI003D1483C2